MRRRNRSRTDTHGAAMKAAGTQVSTSGLRSASLVAAHPPSASDGLLTNIVEPIVGMVRTGYAVRVVERINQAVGVKLSVSASLDGKCAIVLVSMEMVSISRYGGNCKFWSEAMDVLAMSVSVERVSLKIPRQDVVQVYAVVTMW